VNELTMDVVRQVLPTKFARAITDENVAQWNLVTSDPDMAAYYRENFITYSKVLNEGKFTVDEYLNAVMYCSHRLAGETTKDSYLRVFPHKAAEWLVKGVKTKTQGAYVSMYNNTKLVRKIMEQSVIPIWVLNQDKAQAAINVLADLMDNADSEKVRSDSANALLNHLKKPDNLKVELDIGVKEGSELANLQKVMADLAQAQLAAIQSGGVNALGIAESRIVEAEVIEHEGD
jgi:hypothetical protein